MIEEHNGALIACHKIGKEYIASNNIKGDITKTYAPTAELAINAMKEHLDGENNVK